MAPLECPAATGVDIDKDRYARAKALFLSCLDVPEEERGSFLARSCANDVAIAREVEALLGIHRALGTLAFGNPRGWIPPLDAPGPGGSAFGRDPLLDADGVSLAPDSGLNGALPDPVLLQPPCDLGPFRVLSLLGSGGMGRVYLSEEIGAADHTDDPPPRIALKILSAGRYSPQILARFHLEAEILRRIDHTGIAQFHGTGSVEVGGQSLPYISMEYVEGRPLRDFVHPARGSTRGRLALLILICEAVEAAHEQGIVHRDLKPENILVRENGWPKILDFGIARMTGLDFRATALLTGADELVGTLRYMSPEQAAGRPEDIDARTDVYALGVIAYELLTGAMPYDLGRESLGRAVATIARTPPARAGAVLPELRGDLEAVLETALRKDPADRYASAGAMARDLRACLEGAAPSVRPRRFWPRARRRIRILKDSGRSLFGDPATRNRRAAALAIAAAVLASLVYLLTLAGRGADKPTLKSIYVALDDSDNLTQNPDATREDLLEGMRILETTRPRLLQTAERPFTTDLLRYIDWRLGETSFKLAGIEHAPERFRQAERYYARADRQRFDPLGLAAMDSTETLYGQVARVGRHHPLSGRAGAAEALAEVETPVRHLLTAAILREAALMAHLDPSARDYAPTTMAETMRREDDAILMNDLGRVLTNYGAVVDSISRIEAALGKFATIDTATAFNRPFFYADMRASFLRNFGRAWLEKAERTGSAAALDSALARLEAARTLMVNESGNPVTGETARLLVRAHLAGARFANRPNDLAIAAAEADRLLRAIGPAADPVLRARAQMISAETAEAQAEPAAEAGVRKSRYAAGSEPLLARADSLLDAAAAVLTPERFPIANGELLLLQARAARIRFQLGAQEEDRGRALARIDAARQVVVRAQHPSLHRRIDAEALLVNGGR